MSVREMCCIALMSALLCIVAPVTIPIAGPVPLSLATLPIYLAGTLLGSRRGVLAVGLYILIGAIGLPVFSGFSGGVQRLIGVTGGYLVGYLPCVWVVGLASDRWGKHKWVCLVSMALGTILCYAVGTAWFMVQAKIGLVSALMSCVLPFLPGDMVKIIGATALTTVLKERIPRK